MHEESGCMLFEMYFGGAMLYIKLVLASSFLKIIPHLRVIFSLFYNIPPHVASHPLWRAKPQVLRGKITTTIQPNLILIAHVHANINSLLLSLFLSLVTSFFVPPL